MDSDRPARGAPPQHAAAAADGSQDDLAVVAEAVKAEDLDAWLAGLLVPQALQRRHWAVWGLVTDVLAVPWKVSEPTLGLIRLRWWLDELAADAPVQHPLNRLVHAAMEEAPALRTGLAAFIEAVAGLLAEPLGEEGVEAWLKASERLALALVAAEDDSALCEETKARLEALGRAWGCATLLRRAPHVRRSGLPLLRGRSVARHLVEEGRAAHDKTRQGRAARRQWDRGRKALLRAFSLSPLWLKAADAALQAAQGQGREATMPPLVPPSQAARQWRLLKLRLSGRIV